MCFRDCSHYGGECDAFDRSRGARDHTDCFDEDDVVVRGTGRREVDVWNAQDAIEDCLRVVPGGWLVARGC
jgi:hypothetical protein